ncbi:MAG: hypothetical protein M0R06_21360 [Sphaerochaeta sp.]|jgi:hypothetical protein|nr:hypothetical protein [Sphaerochaeta sp.]
MILKIWDNGGKTFDRYMVRIRNDYYVMSNNPLSPQGINQYCWSYGDLKEGRHLGKLIYNCGSGNYRALPKDVRIAIADRT